jgi:predicted DNA-binding transcriptional regulator AlpA
VKELLTEKEAAAFFSIERNTLNKWRSIGKGPKYYKIGGAVRYKISDLEAFIRPLGGAA